MQQWFDSPAGRYLLDWEQAAFDESVADIFGYHAIQLGLPAVDALRANRMPHRWLGLEPGADAGGRRPDVVIDTHTLPFDAASLDLVLLGTRVDAASGRGSAILATPDGQQKSVGVGEEIMPGVRLAAVEFESVTLDRGGAREQLYIDQSGSAADAAPPRQDKK